MQRAKYLLCDGKIYRIYLSKHECLAIVEWIRSRGKEAKLISWEQVLQLRKESVHEENPTVFNPWVFHEIEELGINQQKGGN